LIARLEGITLRIMDFVSKRRAYKRQHRGVLGINYHSG
jgi:hypothetical protein